jgi:hypothetical protein
MRAPSITLILLAGCAHQGDEGLFILNNSQPNGTICALTSDPAQPFLAQGRIAAASPEGYVLTPLIESRITAVMGHELERTIHLEGANVTLSMVSSSGSLSQVSQYTALFSGSVAPLSAVNVSFQVLPAMSAAGQYNVDVTVFGTLGGGRIDGQPFDYPITVCDNCITRNLGSCTGATITNFGNPCNPYQDGIVDCCTDSTGQLLCPGVAM